MSTSPESSSIPFTRAVFYVLALTWLPLGILLSSLIRHLPGAATDNPLMFLFGLIGSLLSLAVLAPCGLPLAYAWREIYKIGYPRVAWTAFALLAPLAAVATLFAGLVGPIAIVLYAAVLSLPAWIAYAVLRWRCRAQQP